MQSIINDFTPKERALLFTALRAFKQSAELAFTETTNTIANTMPRKFYRDTQSNCTELSNKIFAECFVEDLDYMDQYTKELSALNTYPAESFGG